MPKVKKTTKTTKKKPAPVRREGWTVFTFNLPQSLKDELFADAAVHGRYPVQLTRMAVAHCIKNKWVGVDVVE